MKKKLILSLACLLAVSAFGQEVNTQNLLKNVNWEEDTTEVKTINDIVKEQQDLTSKKYRESHFRNVWSRKTYLDLSYNTTKLSPDQPIKTGVGAGLVPEFKSDWGASLQWGHSFAFHKNPIANMVQINLDWSYMDLNVDHFKCEGDGKNLYDSRSILPNNDGKEYFYMPWNLEKYNICYGMSIGPSVDVAPFTWANAPALHHIKVNLYYHIGYHASFLFVKNQEEADINQSTKNPTDMTEEEKDVYARFYKMKDNVKHDFGHGLTQSFGFSVIWKFVGVGYEHRSASVEYIPLSSSDFGSDTYKFKSSTNRVFLQFRL